MKKILVILCTLFLWLSLLSLSNIPYTQSAVSKLYKLQFDASKSIYYEDIHKTTTTTESNTYDISFGTYKVRSFCIYLYSSIRGTETNLAKGESINYSNINIEAHSSEIVTTGGLPTRITAYSIVRRSDSYVVASYTSPNSTSSSSISIYSGTLPDGEYDIYITWVCIDKAGNGDDKKTLTASITTSFVIDTTKPIVSSDVGDNSISSDSIYTNSAFSINFSDSLSGLRSAVVEKPSGEKTTTQLSKNTSYTLDIPSTQAEGLYTFYATDYAGNTSASYYVYLDKTSPNITVSDISGNVLTGEYLNKSFKVTGSDSVSSTSITYNPQGGGEKVSYTGTYISSSNGGEYNFECKDKAGNSAIKTITFDNIQPVCFFTKNSEQIENNQKVSGEISTTFSDVGSSVSVKKIKVPGSTAYTTTILDGYTLSGRYTLCCEDLAGNISSEVTVILDNTKPSISISNGSFFDTVVNDFSVLASDSITGCTLFYKTPLMSEYTESSTLSQAFDTLGSDGKYYFYSVDEVGNTSDVYWVQLSVAVPQATCIQDNINNRAKFTWLDSSTGLLNGVEYTKDTWIIGEGYYELVLTNSSNRSATFSVTLSHLYEEIARTQANCTEDEVISYRCKSCGDTKMEVGKLRTGHDLDGELIGATCYEGAYYHYTCVKCGLEFDGESLSPTSHSYTSVVTNPTCTERGYTTYTCSLCGGVYIDDYIDKLGHDYKESVIGPTCIEDGYTIHSCSRCTSSYVTDSVPKLGHDYVESVVQPTCTVNGKTVHSCSRCDDEYYDNIVSPLGHIYEEERISITCESDGCVRHKCLRCTYYYDTDVISSSGHRYFSEVIREATCTEDGLRFFKCSKCGSEKTETIKSFGHSYTYEDNKDGEGITRKYVCSRCGVFYEEELEGKYQEVSSFASFLVSKYTPYMWYILGGSAGVWSIFIGVKYVVARKMEEIVNAKKMLSSYILGLVVLAIILAIGPILITGVVGAL